LFSVYTIDKRTDDAQASQSAQAAARAMNPISELEEWSRTGHGVCLDYMPPKRVPGTLDHAVQWTVALGIVVGDTLQPHEFQGKPCATAKESKKDAAAQAVKALLRQTVVAASNKENGSPMRIEPAALFVAHNSRVEAKTQT